MRWRIQIDPVKDPIEIELLEIRDQIFKFKVGKEIVSLSHPKVFPFSLTTDELDLTFEAWNKERWRGVSGSETFTVKSLSWESTSAGAQKEIRTQMPGRVLKIFVKPGDSVKANQTLLIVEAMKMENEIRAATDGKVKDVSVQPGQSLESGSLLIRLE